MPGHLYLSCLSSSMVESSLDSISPGHVIDSSSHPRLGHAHGHPLHLPPLGSLASLLFVNILTFSSNMYSRRDSLWLWCISRTQTKTVCPQITFSSFHFPFRWSSLPFLPLPGSTSVAFPQFLPRCLFLDCFFQHPNFSPPVCQLHTLTCWK